MEGRGYFLHTCKNGQDCSPHWNNRLQKEVNGLPGHINTAEGHMTTARAHMTGHINTAEGHMTTARAHMTGHMQCIPEKHWQCRDQPSILQEYTTAAETITAQHFYI